VKSSLANTISFQKKNRDALDVGTRAFFRARLRNRLYNLVLTKFEERKASEGLTRAQLARRMGKKPEVVTRLLGAPGNWGLDTVSDLLLAIAGEELDGSSSDPEKRPPMNSRSADWDSTTSKPTRAHGINGGKAVYAKMTIDG
jgi:hypothetical protein